MINKLKIAIVSENYEELEALSNELEHKISEGHLTTLSLDELSELKELIHQSTSTLEMLRHKDLEKLKKLKNSLKYLY